MCPEMKYFNLEHGDKPSDWTGEPTTNAHAGQSARSLESTGPNMITI